MDVVYIPPYPEPDKKPIHLLNLESWEDKPEPPLLNKSDFYSVSQSSIFLKGVFAKNERGYRLNAIKSAYDRY